MLRKTKNPCDFRPKIIFGEKNRKDSQVKYEEVGVKALPSKSVKSNFYPFHTGEAGVGCFLLF